MTAYLNKTFDLNEHELVELFDEVNLWGAPFGLLLLDTVRYRKHITALDIGFGAGFPLTELAMRLGSTSKVYGIDPWERATQRAERKLGLYGIQNVEIIRGVAENIPLPDAHLDLIVSNNGINNVQDLPKALSECARTLKPGGQFVQSMNLNTTMHEFYDAMEQALRELELPEAVENMRAQIYKMRKPLEEMTSLLEAHGFKVLSVLHDSFSYKFADGSALLNHYFMQLGFMGGWKSVLDEAQQAPVFERVEAILNEQAASNGVVQLTVPFVVIDCERVSSPT